MRAGNYRKHIYIFDFLEFTKNFLCFVENDIGSKRWQLISLGSLHLLSIVKKIISHPATFVTSEVKTMQENTRYGILHKIPRIYHIYFQ